MQAAIRPQFTAEFTCQVIEKTIDWPRTVRSIDSSDRPDSPGLMAQIVIRAKRDGISAKLPQLALTYGTFHNK